MDTVEGERKKYLKKWKEVEIAWGMKNGKKIRKSLFSLEPFLYFRSRGEEKTQKRFFP